MITTLEAKGEQYKENIGSKIVMPPAKQVSRETFNVIGFELLRPAKFVFHDPQESDICVLRRIAVAKFNGNIVAA